MATFVHGRNTRVLCVDPTTTEAWDLSAYFNDASPSMQGEAVETTTFQRGDSKAYISGQKSGTISMAGFYDGTVGAIDEILSSAGLSPLNTSNDATRSFAVFPNGGADGDICYMGTGIQGKYDLKSPVAGAVTIDSELTTSGGLWRGSGGVLSFTGAGTSYSAITDFTGKPVTTNENYAKNTKGGGLLFMAVTSLTGTTPTCTVDFLQGNATSTYTSTTATQLVANNGLPAPQGTSQVLTGSISGDTILRVVLGGTSPAATVFYAFARY